MKIFPAIDLYKGCAVRLYKGDYSKVTVYSADPASVAAKMAGSGAEYIHTVDLEGARDGGTPNFETVVKIKKRSGVFCEIGGGIRDMKTVEKYINAGLDRVILGTAAISDTEFLQAAVKEYGDKIAVSADIRDGFVAAKGWLELSDCDIYTFCGKMCDTGVKTLIVTDISKDGVMAGANHGLYREISEEFDINIVASGGVCSIEDVKKLRALGIYGAITGKAYYEGKIDLREAAEAAK